MDENTSALSSLSNDVPIASTNTSGPAPDGIETTSRQVIFGDIGMHICSDGVWHYRGTPINRPALVKLFASVLRRDNAGAYWLITPAEVAPVSVEDAPFIGIDFDVSGKGQEQTIELHTNIETSLTINSDHPLKLLDTDATHEARPYVHQPNGLDIRLSRAVYYDLVALGTEEKRNNAHIFGIWSGGVFHELGEIDEEDIEGQPA